MSKPLTMTEEKEREYRACCTSGGTEVDPVFAELDATRADLAAAEAKLADERKHADWLASGLHYKHPMVTVHSARRAAEVK